jgi:tRNA(Ile2) C34 agmatinyltransferase TiaS
MTKYLIGIDDTDNQTSRGTGFIVRELARLLKEVEIAEPQCVSRHQLYFHPDIPYTSHNSSACLEVDVLQANKLHDFCRRYLLDVAAEGSDVGLCIVEFDHVTEAQIDWGLRAKKEILTLDDAKKLAIDNNILLEGLTGTHGGMIGSLAACGLRKYGNDGRILMLAADFRSFSGVSTASEICRNFHIQKIFDTFDSPILADATITLEEGWKPLLKNGLYSLMVEKDDQHTWKSISKELLRKISS